MSTFDSQTTCTENSNSAETMQMSELTKQKHERKVRQGSKINKFKNWNKEDTRKFFRTLELFGTDFYMINFLFKDRTRTQLKRKFKKERDSAELAISLRKCKRTKFLKLKERLAQVQQDNQNQEPLSSCVRKRFESLASVDSLDIELVEELKQFEGM